MGVISIIINNKFIFFYYYYLKYNSSAIIGISIANPFFVVHSSPLSLRYYTFRSIHTTEKPSFICFKEALSIFKLFTCCTINAIIEITLSLL